MLPDLEKAISHGFDNVYLLKKHFSAGSSENTAEEFYSAKKTYLINFVGILQKGCISLQNNYKDFSWEQIYIDPISDKHSRILLNVIFDITLFILSFKITINERTFFDTLKIVPNQNVNADKIVNNMLSRNDSLKRVNYHLKYNHGISYDKHLNNLF